MKSTLRTKNSEVGGTEELPSPQRDDGRIGNSRATFQEEMPRPRWSHRHDDEQLGGATTTNDALAAQSQMCRRCGHQRKPKSRQRSSRQLRAVDHRRYLRAPSKVCTLIGQHNRAVRNALARKNTSATEKRPNASNRASTRSCSSVHSSEMAIERSERNAGIEGRQ